MSLLSVRDISVHRGLLQVIHSITFEIHPGECVALIGANGSGKSTLIECLIGLIPSASGTLVRPKIGWVPEGRRVFPDLTVQENLEIGAHQIKNRQERHLLMKRVFEIFPILAERFTQAAGTLSGGQQQMLAIGRAWMSKPDLLIVDEVSLGLAPLIVKDVFVALTQWVKEEPQRGLMIVEQNARLALSVADRGLVLESGRLIHEGSANALLNDAKLAKSYFSDH